MTNLTTNLTNSLKLTLKISGVIGACFAFSACGAIAEKITEEGAERIIEAESGENVDIDFDGGDGSFSIETEDGGFSFDEDGNFVVTDQDGSVFTGSANDDQILVTDGDGNQVLNVTGDGENGELSLQGEDGETVYRVVTDIPAEWPSDIPRPDGLAIEGGTYLAAEGETLISLNGTPSGSVADYVDGYVGGLAAAGLAETGRFDSTQDGAVTAQRTYENDQWTLNVSGYQDDSSSVVNISLVQKAN